jgi:hypothetical protein
LSNAVLRTLGRFVLVPLALLLALAAAGIVLVTLGQERVVAQLGGRQIDVDGVFNGLEVLLRVGIVALSVQTLLPILLLVVGGEVMHIRRPLYYVLGGGLALALVPLLAGLGRSAGVAGLAGLWTVFATAGFAGGLVYWLIAGRSA